MRAPWLKRILFIDSHLSPTVRKRRTICDWNRQNASRFQSLKLLVILHTDTQALYKKRYILSVKETK